MEVTEMARTGRPKGTHNKDAVCSLRLDDQTKKRLEAYCRKMNMGKSQALRQAIELLIGQEET